MTARLLRAYLRSALPGRTRVAAMIAGVLPPLQHVPLEVVAGQRVYLDMRDVMARDLLAAFPFATNPWEPDEQEILRRVVRPGDIVFDIGAHFGEHAVLLAALVGPSGRVLAFEPNPERFHALTRTVSQFDNGTVVPVALSDNSGEATLYVPELHAMASLMDWTEQRVGNVRAHQCRTERLDTLVDSGRVPLPTFVKCDVEGAELAVFRGGSRTLNRADAPIILYEANARAARAFNLSVFAATEFLASLPAAQYSFYWVQPHATLVPIRQPVHDVELFNLFAVPRAKQHLIEHLQPSE